MVNRPKKIGTAAETAVTRYAIAHGFPLAERRALAGGKDKGDILLAPGAILEVKSGERAEGASDELIRAWWDETVIERHNAGADVAVLVTKRHRKGVASVGQWWAHVDLHALQNIVLDSAWPPPEHPETMIHCTLADMLRLIRTAGYGSTPCPEWGRP